MNGGSAGPAAPAHPIHDALAAQVGDQPGMAVVDLGCGPGDTLAAIAARRPTAVLIGVDLAHAAARAAAAAVRGRSLMVCADATRELPLADACVDVVVSHNSLEQVVDPVAVMAEARRLLRPGTGRAVWSHTDFDDLAIDGADPALPQRICAAYAHLPQPWMGHIDADIARRLPQLVRRAGFEVLRVDGHRLATARLDGHARRRVEEIVAVVRGHARRGQTDLDAAKVDAWYTQLIQADQARRFRFAESAVIVVAGATHCRRSGRPA
jgi:ubiquinone/menaquinone biosynthesis C-methylase UbiE